MFLRLVGVPIDTLGNLFQQGVVDDFQIKTCCNDQSAALLAKFTMTVE
jgi:hypothetical protein